MSGRSWHGATRWNRGQFVCVADANRMVWVERVINYSQKKLLFAQMYRCVWIFCVFVAVTTTSNKNIKHQDIDLLHLRTVKARQYIFMALFRNSLLHLMAILLSFFFFFLLPKPDVRVTFQAVHKSGRICMKLRKLGEFRWKPHSFIFIHIRFICWLRWA